MRIESKVVFQSRLAATLMTNFYGRVQVCRLLIRTLFRTTLLTDMAIASMLLYSGENCTYIYCFDCFAALRDLI